MSSDKNMDGPYIDEVGYTVEVDVKARKFYQASNNGARGEYQETYDGAVADGLARMKYQGWKSFVIFEVYMEITEDGYMPGDSPLSKGCRP